LKFNRDIIFILNSERFQHPLLEDYPVGNKKEGNKAYAAFAVLNFLEVTESGTISRLKK